MVTKLFGPLFYELWFRNTARVRVSVDEPSDVKETNSVTIYESDGAFYFIAYNTIVFQRTLGRVKIYTE